MVYCKVNGSKKGFSHELLCQCMAKFLRDMVLGTNEDDNAVTVLCKVELYP